MSSNQDTDVCYICLDNKSPLVAACTQCHAIVHKDCLKIQIEKGYDKCSQCQSPLEYRTVTKVDSGAIRSDTFICCQNFGKTLLTIFYWLYILVGLPLLALGKSVVDFEASGIINIIAIYLLFCVFLPPCYKKFWLWPNQSEYDQYCFRYHMFYDEKSTWKTVLTMLKLMFSQAFIITIAHFVGYIVLTLIFDEDIELFTWKTSLMGVVYILFLVITLLIVLIFCGIFYISCQYCYQSVKERYFKQDSQVVIQEVV